MDCKKFLQFTENNHKILKRQPRLRSKRVQHSIQLPARLTRYTQWHWITFYDLVNSSAKRYKTRTAYVKATNLQCLT